MAIDVDLLLDEDIIRFTNVDPTIGISPLDADDFNNNNTEFKDKLNELIAAVISADDDNVKLTGAQNVDGIKTFLNNIKFSSGYGIGDSFLLINAQGSGDSSIRFKDTTSAALFYDATNNLFKLLTDVTDGTSYAQLKIAAGSASVDAVRYDQVPKLTTTNSFTQDNTFATAITQSVAATSANHLVRKTEFDTAISALSLGGILQQTITPATTNNTLWIDTNGVPKFVRGTGSTFMPVNGFHIGTSAPTTPTPAVNHVWLDTTTPASCVWKYYTGSAWKKIMPATIDEATTFTGAATFNAGFSVAASQTISAGNNKITNVDTPASSSDAATKGYVDSASITDGVSIYGTSTAVNHGTDTTIALGTTRKNTSTSVYTVGTNEITVLVSGTYLIMYRCGYTSQKAIELYLQEDTGGGYSEVANSRVKHSGDSGANNDGSVSGFLIQDVTANYKYRLMGYQAFGSTVTVNAAELTILRIK